MNPKGNLFIIAAASGTGKTSLAKALVDSMSNIKVSISHTTRQIRPGEVANKNYFYVTHSQFEELIKKNAFLEYAKVFDNYYGTSRTWVSEQLTNGEDVILDIDWQGAEIIRNQMPCVTIFLLPPSRSTLRTRLENRKRDDVKTIDDRLNKASTEIAHYHEFDYLVINDDFTKALSDLQSIVQATRLRTSYQTLKYQQLIKELL